MRSALFWDVTQRILVVIDSSGLTIGPILNFKAFQKEFHEKLFLDRLTLEDGTDILFPKRR